MQNGLRAAAAALLLVVAACAPKAQPAEPPAQATGVPSAAAAASTAVPRSGSDQELILATTTSTQDSGLLDVLVPLFEQETGYRVKTVSVGTGAALALGARGEADVVLVHAPDSEKQWMAQDNGTARLLVMHNDFVLVGPPEDPAKVKGTSSAVDAMKRVATAPAPFVSRGDNSGTQKAELALWKQAQIHPKGQPWYVESGTGMGQTLTIADQKRAYTHADRPRDLAGMDGQDRLASSRRGRQSAVQRLPRHACQSGAVPEHQDQHRRRQSICEFPARVGHARGDR